MMEWLIAIVIGSIFGAMVFAFSLEDYEATANERAIRESKESK